MTLVQKLKRSFWRNEDGATAITLSMVFPILIGFGVLAVDSKIKSVANTKCIILQEA